MIFLGHVASQVSLANDSSAQALIGPRFTAGDAQSTGPTGLCLMALQCRSCGRCDYAFCPCQEQVCEQASAGSTGPSEHWHRSGLCARLAAGYFKDINYFYDIFDNCFVRSGESV